VLEDAAVVLAGREDLRRARAAHAEAVEIYTGLGADWDLLRLATRLRPYGLRRPGSRRRPATGWDALTATEQKVARLVAAGSSNPDIASDLFLSRRTVEVHVSHILAKLGARSRIELALAGRPANSGVRH
jgi:DNA-binding NarL/FixJ family response regulator